MTDLLANYVLPFGAGIFAYVAGKWFARQPLLEEIAGLREQLGLTEKLYRSVADRKYEADRENTRLAADLAYWRPEHTYHRCKYDDFVGQRIGTYVTRDGRRGYVLQEIGNKVVHVYATDNLLDYHVIDGGSTPDDRH